MLRYETSPEGMARAAELFPSHQALWSQCAGDGTLLAIGPMADPSQGAMGIFTTREAAESFVAADPFVLEGVVAGWQIQEWNEVLIPEA